MVWSWRKSFLSATRVCSLSRGCGWTSGAGRRVSSGQSRVWTRGGSVGRVWPRDSENEKSTNEKQKSCAKSWGAKRRTWTPLKCRASIQFSAKAMKGLPARSGRSISSAGQSGNKILDACPQTWMTPKPAAGKAICGRAVSGWKFWQYEQERIKNRNRVRGLRKRQLSLHFGLQPSDVGHRMQRHRQIPFWRMTWKQKRLR